MALNLNFEELQPMFYPKGDFNGQKDAVKPYQNLFTRF